MPESVKEMTYYKIHCPYAPSCPFYGEGNDKDFLNKIYLHHYMQQHYHKPIIERLKKNDKLGIKKKK